MMTTILIVEDDKLLGKEITEELQDAGYDARWCRTGEEAFQVLDSQKVDLVYLDIMLPDMDGYEILKRIKETEAYKDTPVVMLSNLGQVNEIERAIELGAKDYLVKARMDLDNLVELTKSKFLQFV
jgi:DNA-binding response OmpR family regulator